jgi:hypothetical protein
MEEKRVKMKVIRENGEIVTLDLDYPAFIGAGDVLNKMFCADLTEHFFTKDGYYDGWGKAMRPPISMQ